jgi:hypothetical protein
MAPQKKQATIQSVNRTIVLAFQGLTDSIAPNYSRPAIVARKDSGFGICDLNQAANAKDSLTRQSAIGNPKS